MNKKNIVVEDGNLAASVNILISAKAYRITLVMFTPLPQLFPSVTA